MHLLIRQYPTRIQGVVALPSLRTDYPKHRSHETTGGRTVQCEKKRPTIAQGFLERHLVFFSAQAAVREMTERSPH